MFLSDLAIRRPVLDDPRSSLKGLRQMTSSSGEQRSTITLECNLERPIEAARRMIETGLRTPGFVVVRGTDPGEQVVVSGGERLTEGAEVLPTLVMRLPMSGREVTP